MKDSEILLLSWTQLAAALILTPKDQEMIQAQSDLTRILETQFHITNLELLTRTYDEYAIVYKEKDQDCTLSFSEEEVDELM